MPAVIDAAIHGATQAVKITVTVTGGATVTVTRYGESGGAGVVIRGAKDADISSGGWSGEDYEAPQNQTLTYRAVVTLTAGGTEAATFILPGKIDRGGDWVAPIGRPELGMRIYVELGGIGGLEHTVQQSIQHILNRPDPVVVSHGRNMWNGTIQFLTLTDVERRDFLQVVGYPVVMFSPHENYGFDDVVFLAVGNVTEERTAGVGHETSRRWYTELHQVARPPATYASLLAGVTWQVRHDELSPWDDVLYAFPDWFHYAGFDL